MTAGEDKLIKKWHFLEKFELQVTQYVSTYLRELKKKPTRIQTTPNGTVVLVSDKFGDVYKLDLETFILEERPLLGPPFLTDSRTSCDSHRPSCQRPISRVQ